MLVRVRAGTLFRHLRRLGSVSWLVVLLLMMMCNMNLCKMIAEHISR